MYFLYVLESKKDGSRYIGITKDLKKRLKEHNMGKTKSTRSKVPYELVYFEGYMEKKLARIRELKLKKSASSKKRLFERLELS